MTLSVSLIRKLERVAPEMRDVLLTLVEEVERNREESVTKREFNELKEIVARLAKGQEELTRTVTDLVEAQKRTDQTLGELAEAQKRTEQRLDELAQAQRRTDQTLGELAEAQKRTEQRLGELAQAQRHTEQQLGELAEAQKRTEEGMQEMSRGLGKNREQIGGLSRSVAYALENEAYRKLPAFLAARHGIRVRERIIRAEMADQEINLFAQATRDDQDVVLVGESVLRLDDLSKLRKIRDKLEAVQALFDQPVVPIIVTHFVRPKVLETALAAGIIVVQSFEWEP